MGRIMLNNRVGCIPRGAIVRYGDRYDCPWTPDSYKIASGIIASFETSLSDGILECNCDIPYKANGYTSIELSARGINIWSGVRGSCRWKTDGDYSQNSNVISNDIDTVFRTYEVHCSPNTTYCFIDTLGLKNKKCGLDLALYYSNRTNRTKTTPMSYYYGTTSSTTIYQQFTTPNDCHYLRFSSSYYPAHGNDSFVSINYPGTYMEYHAPAATGFNKGISFGKTIYGGTFEAISGKLISKYNSDGSIKSTPDVIQCATTEITALTDEPNNIWTNCGEVEVKYYE